MTAGGAVYDPYAGQPCRICGAPAAHGWFATATLPGADVPAWQGITCLCQRHYDALVEAGARGRLDRRSGRRWWLGPGGR